MHTALGPSLRPSCGKRVLRDWSSGAQVTLGQATNEQCLPPVVAQLGNGVCDQFGASCRMWECPDAFDVGNGTWAFKWSDQVRLSQCLSLGGDVNLPGHT